VAARERQDRDRTTGPRPRTLDASDRKLLALLSEDATLSYSALGAAVGLSPPAVHERVKRLRLAGVIRRTVALIDPRAVRANIERLHAENPQGSVVIQANAKSKNELLVMVMDASRRAGVYNISLAD